MAIYCVAYIEERGERLVRLYDTKINKVSAIPLANVKQALYDGSLYIENIYLNGNGVCTYPCSSIPLIRNGKLDMNKCPITVIMRYGETVYVVVDSNGVVAKMSFVSLANLIASEGGTNVTLSFDNRVASLVCTTPNGWEVYTQPDEETVRLEAARAKNKAAMLGFPYSIDENKMLFMKPENVAKEHKAIRILVPALGIREEGFFKCTIAELYLPDGLKVISDRALAFCKINKLEIPNSCEKICTQALLGSTITTLRLPKCLKDAPRNILSEMPKLKTVEVYRTDFKISLLDIPRGVRIKYIG